MPVMPDAFFLALYRSAADDLAELDRVSTEGRTRRAREELRMLIDGLRAHTHYVIGLLGRPSSGLKHALFTSLTADYEDYAHRTGTSGPNTPTSSPSRSASRSTG